MHFQIESAKAIKPMVIRFGVVMYDNDDNLIGEYEIALDIDSFVTYELNENNTNVNINAVAVQQHLTTQIAEMQITSLIANGFNGIEWDADEQGAELRETSDDETEVKDSDESEAYTGDTQKLSSDVSEGN